MAQIRDFTDTEPGAIRTRTIHTPVEPSFARRRDCDGIGARVTAAAPLQARRARRRATATRGVAAPGRMQIFQDPRGSYA